MEYTKDIITLKLKDSKIQSTLEHSTIEHKKLQVEQPIVRIASLNLATSQRDERQSPLSERLHIFNELINHQPWFDILVLQEVRGSEPLNVDEVLEQIQTILGGSDIWSFEDRVLLPETARSSHRTIFWNKQKLVHVESKIVVIKPENEKKKISILPLHSAEKSDKRDITLPNIPSYSYSHISHQQLTQPYHTPLQHSSQPQNSAPHWMSHHSMLSALSPCFIPSYTSMQLHPSSFACKSPDYVPNAPPIMYIYPKLYPNTSTSNNSNSAAENHFFPCLSIPYNETLLYPFHHHHHHPSSPALLQTPLSNPYSVADPSLRQKPCTFPYFVKSTFYWVIPACEKWQSDEENDEYNCSYQYDKPTNLTTFTIINVHAPLHQGLRERYWKEISYHLNKTPKAIAIGDFNKFDTHRYMYEKILHTKFKTDLIPKDVITFVSFDEDRDPDGELWKSSLDGCVVNNRVFKGHVDVLSTVQPPRLSDHFFLVASIFWAS